MGSLHCSLFKLCRQFIRSERGQDVSSLALDQTDLFKVNFGLLALFLAFVIFLSIVSLFHF